MSNRLIDLLLYLAPRERWLLAALFGLILPLGLLFGVLFPLQEARTVQIASRTEAIALNLWVQDRVREYAQIAQVAETGVPEVIGTSGVEQSLIVAGLRDQITELSGASDGRIDLRFDSVRFTFLMDWLSQVDLAWGYDIAMFRFEAGSESGNVAAALTLMPQSR